MEINKCTSEVFIKRNRLMKMNFVQERGTSRLVKIETYRVLAMFSKYYNTQFVSKDDKKVWHKKKHNKRKVQNTCEKNECKQFNARRRGHNQQKESEHQHYFFTKGHSKNLICSIFVRRNHYLQLKKKLQCCHSNQNFSC